MTKSSAWSWRHAIQESELESLTKLVLYNLSFYINDRGEAAWPSVDRQAKETGLARRTVLKHLALAREAGWILVKKEKRPGQLWAHNVYFVCQPETVIRSAPQDVPQYDLPGAPDAPGASAEDAQTTVPGARDDTNQVHQMHPIGPGNIPGILPSESDSSVGVSDSKTESCTAFSSSCDDVDLFGGKPASSVVKLPRLSGEEIDEFFDKVFWPEYPRKCSKKEARRAMHRLLRKLPRSQAEDLKITIMQGLKRYKATKPERQDWLHPSTFLNGERWTDREPEGAATIDGLTHDEIMAHTLDNAFRLTFEQRKYRRQQIEAEQRRKDEETARRLARA